MSVITHNLSSQFSNRQLKITSGKKAKSAEKLSTGYKVNRSADDAAGLTISEKMRWQIRGLNRASDNIGEGISLLQVADGALNEVHSILHRMRELSVQGANDTNTELDRQAIQMEIEANLDEIDRIGFSTEFNSQKIFDGGYVTVLDADGNPVNISQIPFEDFDIANAQLRGGPFSQGSDGSQLNLGVSTVADYSPPINCDLVYGRGNTSHSSLRYQYDDGNGNTISGFANLENMSISDYEYDANSNTYYRTFTYDAGNNVSFSIVQSIEVEANTAGSDTQFYNMSYKVTNTGTVDNVKVDFMFNSDSAYNNDDRCEGYFIGGNQVDSFRLYTNNAEYLNQQTSNSNIYDMTALGTDSFSIIDKENAFPFSAKVAWGNGTTPDTVSIGNWSLNTGDWDYYNNLTQNLGGSTSGSDMAFSLIWNDELDANASQEYKFQYGIAKTTADPNLQGVDLSFVDTPRFNTNQLDLWIQGGSTEGSGMYITIGKMNSATLNIGNVNVTSHRNASASINTIDKAITTISSQRSSMGAQQNRLEHMRAIDDGTSENTQAAESRIRDTDMASEMMNYSKHSILEQAGQSMLAQSNLAPQGILQLLQ